MMYVDRVIVKWADGAIWENSEIIDVNSWDRKQPFRVDFNGNKSWPEIDRIKPVFKVRGMP